MEEDVLEEAFDFNKVDLAANQKGFLSKKQLQNFEWNTSQDISVFRFILYLTPFAIIPLYLGFGLTNPFFISLALLIIFEVLGIFAYRFMASNAKKVLESPTVELLQGIAEHRTEIITYRQHTRTYYYLKIASREFHVSNKQYSALKAGIVYKVYHATGKIMSCETAVKSFFQMNN